MSQRRAKLFLVAGHNGAGKTTFLKEFVRIERVKYINADEIAQKISVNKPSLLAIKAGKIALKKIKKFRDERRNFVVETTLSGKMWEILIPDFKKSS